MSWGQPLNHNTTQQYNHLSGDLKSIDDIDTPRFILETIEPSKNPFQLHCFCDASTTAYAAAVYIRQPNAKDAFKASFSWLKHEWHQKKHFVFLDQSSVQLYWEHNLSNQSELPWMTNDFPTSKFFAWTDFTNTLAWIKNHPSSWKTFVTNRKAKIQNRSRQKTGKMFPFESNPADRAKRGVSPRNLQSHRLW